MTFNKEKYWSNREKAVRGQGEIKKSVVLPNPDSNAEIGFDQNGQMIVKNRKYKRTKAKLPNDVSYTKKKITKDQRKKDRKKGRR